MALPHHKGFQSSNVEQFHYEPTTQTLRVWFTSGTDPYDYAGVKPTEYLGLCEAPSKGQYLAQQIKPKHPVAKVKGKP